MEIIMIDYNELLELASQGDENAQAMITNMSTQFADVTIAAVEMSELMSQTFKVRIKGSTDLSFCISCLRKKFAKEYIGKWITVSVYWDSSHFCMKTKDGTLLQFSRTEFFKHVTQKGQAPKMFNVWALAQI